MKKKNGFTLIELLAVIVILAIIALIAIPVIINIMKKANEGAKERTYELIENAAELYLATEMLGFSDDIHAIHISELKEKGYVKTEETDGYVVITRENRKYNVHYTGRDKYTHDSSTEYVLEKYYGVKIGDYVNYNHNVGSEETYTSLQANNGYGDQVFNKADYTGGWRVLGLEDGKIKLISASIVQPATGGNTSLNSTHSYYTIKGEAGYIKGIDELNNISKLYAQGKYASSARSVEMKDLSMLSVGFDNIEKECEYIPNTSIECNFMLGLGAYGTNVKFRITNGQLKFTNDNGSTATSDKEYFYYFDNENQTFIRYADLDSDALAKEYAIKNSYKVYHPVAFGKENESKNWYKLLYDKASGTQYSYSPEVYFLATRRDYANANGYVSYGIMRLNGRAVTASTLSKINKTTDGTFELVESSASFGVRPVILLNSNASLIAAEGQTTHTTQQTAWILRNK